MGMYERIIQDEGYSHVVVVTSPDRRNPCVRWFQEFATRSTVKIDIETTSLMEAACRLASARNLVLSYSTFPESMAMVSNRVRRVYSREHFQGHSILDCKMWPGTTLHKYTVPVSEGS